MRPEYFEPFPTTADLTAHLKSKPETAHITAAEFIKDHLPKESVFQAKILATLEDWRKNRLIDPDSIIWKNNAGVYNRNGLPDIMMVSNGLYFAFEVKRPYVGRLSPLQKKAIANINAAGGHAASVCYVSEVKAIITAADSWFGKEDSV